VQKKWQCVTRETLKYGQWVAFGCRHYSETVLKTPTKTVRIS